MNIFAKALAAVSLTIAGAPGAYAALLGGGVNTNVFVVTTVEKPAPVKGNETAVAFRTIRANTVVVVTYNAECSVTGSAGWLSVRIAVDGRDALPAVEGEFALCAVSGSTPVPAAVTRQAVIVVPQAGLHNVRVFARLIFASAGRLDDSSTIIQD